MTGPPPLPRETVPLHERTPRIRLTSMQDTIATLIAEGRFHQEVADALGMSVSGVRKHLETVARKLKTPLPVGTALALWCRGDDLRRYQHLPHLHPRPSLDPDW